MNDKSVAAEPNKRSNEVFCHNICIFKKKMFRYVKLKEVRFNQDFMTLHMIVKLIKL